MSWLAAQNALERTTGRCVAAGLVLTDAGVRVSRSACPMAGFEWVCVHGFSRGRGRWKGGTQASFESGMGTRRSPAGSAGERLMWSASICLPHRPRSQVLDHHLRPSWVRASGGQAPSTLPQRRRSQVLDPRRAVSPLRAACGQARATVQVVGLDRWRRLGVRIVMSCGCQRLRCESQARSPAGSREATERPPSAAGRALARVLAAHLQGP
jgi:hypothetical protein